MPPVAGATAPDLRGGRTDAGHYLQCVMTGTMAGGSVSGASGFVAVPVQGAPPGIVTTSFAAEAHAASVRVVLRCAPRAAGACGITLVLSTVETLRGGRRVAVSARRAPPPRTTHRTLVVGTLTQSLAPGSVRAVLVPLNALGRLLLARERRLPVLISANGTLIGSISAPLGTARLTLVARAAHASRVRPRRRMTRARRRAVTWAMSAALAGLGTAGWIAPRAAAAATAPAPSSVAPASTPVLAATPYMGWDTYFAFGGAFNEATILDQAHQLIARGLLKAGYRYIWFDVGWWHGTRDGTGQITLDPTQWPHGLAWLTGILHQAGFLVGLYTDAGSVGCGGPGAGSYGHYQQDVNTFAAWGFDAVKVDFCGGVRQGLDPETAYTAFHEAIVNNASHRPMLLSICNFLQPGQYATGTPSFDGSGFDSWTYGPAIANSWRTDTDVGSPHHVVFANVLRNIDADAAHPQAAGPGHWNDPDYLGPDQGLSPIAYRTQLSMWAMLAAPLMISDDLDTMTAQSASDSANPEVIAIDQDPAGVQGTLVASAGAAEVWVKPAQRRQPRRRAAQPRQRPRCASPRARSGSACRGRRATPCATCGPTRRRPPAARSARSSPGRARPSTACRRSLRRRQRDRVRGGVGQRGERRRVHAPLDRLQRLRILAGQAGGDGHGARQHLVLTHRLGHDPRGHRLVARRSGAPWSSPRAPCCGATAR